MNEEAYRFEKYERVFRVYVEVTRELQLDFTIDKNNNQSEEEICQRLTDQVWEYTDKELEEFDCTNQETVDVSCEQIE